jgi:hypothetical protein
MYYVVGAVAVLLAIVFINMSFATHHSNGQIPNVLVNVTKHASSTVADTVRDLLGKAISPSQVFIRCDSNLLDKEHRRRALPYASTRDFEYVLFIRSDTRLANGWDDICRKQVGDNNEMSVVSTLPRATLSQTFTALTPNGSVGSRYVWHPPSHCIPNILASWTFLFYQTRTCMWIPGEEVTSDLLLSAMLKESNVKVVVPVVEASVIRDGVMHERCAEDDRVKSFLSDFRGEKGRLSVDSRLGLTNENDVEEMICKYGTVDEVVRQQRRRQYASVVDVETATLPL